MGAELFHTDGQMVHTWRANSRFSEFLWTRLKINTENTVKFARPELIIHPFTVTMVNSKRMGDTIPAMYTSPSARTHIHADYDPSQPPALQTHEVTLTAYNHNKYFSPSRSLGASWSQHNMDSSPWNSLHALELRTLD